LSDVASHWGRLGRTLGSAVEHYNKAVGSMETRVLPSARKFKELEASPLAVEIEELTLIESPPRDLSAPELIATEPTPPA
jgi:DNA recombination protein RmuC